MGQNSRGGESFLVHGVAQGLRVLERALAAVSLTRLIVHFLGISQDEWLTIIVEIYRRTTYPFHVPYEYVLSYFGLFLQDWHKDLVTFYIIGCFAQIRYLSLLRRSIREFYSIGEKVSLIEYMSRRIQIGYVVLWPIAIILDNPVRPMRRLLWTHLLRDSRRGFNKELFEILVSGRSALMGFISNIALALAAVLIFLAINSFS